MIGEFLSVVVPRHLARQLERAARFSPVITLTGPRQAGKTTLVRAVFPEHRYLSLEDPDVRQEARADPRGFLAQADRLILDEIQRAPDLLSYLQGIVDEDRRPGRFVVTGSRNLLVMESVSQTLAGRTAVLELHPFSAAELRGAPPLDPRSLDRFPGEPPEPDRQFPVPATDPWGLLAVGFFPAIHNEPTDRSDRLWRKSLVRRRGAKRRRGGVRGGSSLPAKAGGTDRASDSGRHPVGKAPRIRPDDGVPHLFADGYPCGALYPQAVRSLRSYFRTFVERDVLEILRVTDLASFEDFVRLAASRTATELNLTGLARDAGVSDQTARRWLGALETSHLVTRLRLHFENYGKRLRKRPRLHFLDSGLVCYLLGIPDAKTLERHPLRGAIFESFVVSELVKAFSARGEEARLHFWRDTAGHEVDVLMDLGDRRVPVEVRSGRTVPPDAVRNLRRWTALPGNPNRGGALVHGGDREFSLRGCRVAPWFLARGRPR